METILIWSFVSLGILIVAEKAKIFQRLRVTPCVFCLSFWFNLVNLSCSYFKVEKFESIKLAAGTIHSVIVFSLAIAAITSLLYSFKKRIDEGYIHF